MIKQPIRNRQRIKQELHGVSLGTYMHKEEGSLLYFSDLFWGILSKIKSFTGGHVCETGQKATTVMKEGIQVKGGFFYSMKNVLVFLTQSYGWKAAQRNFHSVCNEIKKSKLKYKV